MIRTLTPELKTDKLADPLTAGLELAQELEDLLAIFPPEVNPFPIARQMLAPVQAALDAFVEAVGPVLEPTTIGDVAVAGEPIIEPATTGPLAEERAAMRDER